MIFNLGGLIQFLSLPFKCIFKFQNNVKEAFGFFRMNSRYLKEFEAIVNIKKVWREQNNYVPYFFSKFWKVMKYYKAYYI
jgi:hypothetical protein